LAFVTGAGARGIRVILDLVAQHTSDRHPWFLSARQDARSPFRDYYVRTDHPPRPAPGNGPMFPPPGNGACNNFLRNLDEASLERLDPDAFRDTMDALGPDDDMRIFGRGLRRRLTPMLGATDQGCAWPSACCLPCWARP
jgi:glycosidase